VFLGVGSTTPRRAWLGTSPHRRCSISSEFLRTSEESGSMRHQLDGTAACAPLPRLLLALVMVATGGCGGDSGSSDPIRDNPEFKAAILKSAANYKSAMQKQKKTSPAGRSHPASSKNP